ncbi:hypothetical protein TNCT_262071, partial [Trichonephila clavata]
MMWRYCPGAAVCMMNMRLPPEFGFAERSRLKAFTVKEEVEVDDGLQ